MSLALLVSGLVLAIWIYLIFAHGDFWRGREREEQCTGPVNDRQYWPPIIAVIPARNEAQTLPQCLSSLLAQTYPGDFSIVVVDDESTDGTGEIARSIGANQNRSLTVLSAPSRPSGWTGKVWAQNVGVEFASVFAKPGTYYLMTDADIVYAPTSLSRLVDRAVANRAVLTSYMVRLNCNSFAERMMIPAFVYFFQMLYPFARANRPSSNIAAAAGGCMLIDCAALAQTGGMPSIRAAIIDDCALAGILKKQGPIWIGLASSVESIRQYPAMQDIRHMIARSAYAQLRYSPVLLFGTVFGLMLTFLSAPLLTVHATYPANLFAAAAWLLMAYSFQPTLRYYERSPLWGVGLPIIATVYMVFTMDSAYQHFRGRGGMWKGRAQAIENNAIQD